MLGKYLQADATIDKKRLNVLYWRHSALNCRERYD